MDAQKTWQKKKPPTEFAKLMGRRIRECRERLAITTEELAGMLGLSPASIVQYELGVRSPTYDRFAVMAEILGVSADYLLRGTIDGEAATCPEADQLLKAFTRLTPRDRALVLEVVKSFLKIPPIETVATDDTPP